MKLTKYVNFLLNFNFIFLTLLFTGCSDIALMNPKGLIGLQEKKLILISLGLMLIIVIPVIFMTIFFSIKYRSNGKATYSPNWSHSKKIEFIIWTIPILIILFLAKITWESTHNLDPHKNIYSKNNEIVVNVISLDWKWLFIYPDFNVASINELAIPVNTPIKFNITSNSVMNSFFIPKLGSQIYAMAGMNSNLSLIAYTNGVYKGISSNFSGKGFSGMKFDVLVTNYQDFINWIRKLKISKNEINTIEDYNLIAEPSEYNDIKYFSKVKKSIFEDIVKKFH